MKIVQLISIGGFDGAEIVVRDLHLNRSAVTAGSGFVNSYNPHLGLAESLDREGVPAGVLPVGPV